MLRAETYLKKLSKAIKTILLLAEKNKVKCEAYANVSMGSEIKVRNNEVDSFQINHSTRVSLTIHKNQRQGSITITELTPNSLENAFYHALKISDLTAPDEYAGLADRNLIVQKFINLDLYHPYAITPAAAIKLITKCDQAALNHDPKVTNTEGASLTWDHSATVVANSHDFMAENLETSYSVECSAIASYNDTMQRDYDFTLARNFAELIDPEIIGDNAGAYACDRIGAIKIPTTKTKVLFAPEVAAKLFRYLIAAISGNNIAHKSSFLLDKLHHQILPNFVSIIDHPFILKGLKSSCYDPDGINATIQPIITHGKLNTYLLSNYFAKKLRSTPTGHGGGIYNLFINHPHLTNANPTLSLPRADAITHHDIWQQRQDLMNQMGQGLIVTETIGQGVNLVTGDYSKGACGFWVEHGKIAYPVHEITIAGNLRDFFANIIAIGNDYDYRNNIITGSVLIDQITVAGI